MAETKTKEKFERLYTVPMRKAYEYKRTKRARRATKLMREFVARHSCIGPEAVSLSNALNAYIWSHGMQKPPRKVKIKVVFDGEKAKASLPDEKPAVKKVRRKKGEKKVAEAKGEKKPEEAKPKEAGAKKAETPAEQK